MNDYIVWYSDENNQNMFSKEFTLDELISQKHLDEISDSPLLRNFKIDSINNGIGIKDINGKNIYADCSIVEMYRGLDSFTGYYIYNKNKAHYEFIIIDGCDNDSFGNIIGSSLKIIDTIQENKLGLIK